MLHKTIRFLGIVLGLFFIMFPAWLFYADNNTELLWVHPIMGIIFLVYGIGGYKALSKILPEYKKHAKNHEKNKTSGTDKL